MSIKEELELHQHSHAENRFAVIPTPVRLKAPAEYSGKGVTLAFIDSSFYAHPDLTQPVNRILAFQDVTGEQAKLKTSEPPENWDWHGTQTCVSAAGNGYLSNGIYRGLASDAQVVLVKAGIKGHISEENIARGLRWVIENQDRYKIRIVSISLGGDADVSYRHNAVDQLAEEAITAGLVVVVAAGNSGCTDRHQTVPPANAPSVITVGGYDDKNVLDQKSIDRSIEKTEAALYTARSRHRLPPVKRRKNHSRKRQQRELLPRRTGLHFADGMHRELRMVKTLLRVGTLKNLKTFYGRLRFPVWPTRVPQFGRIEFLLQRLSARIQMRPCAMVFTVMSLRIKMSPNKPGAFIVSIENQERYCGSIQPRPAFLK